MTRRPPRPAAPGSPAAAGLRAGPRPALAGAGVRRRGADRRRSPAGRRLVGAASASSARGRSLVSVQPQAPLVALARPAARSGFVGSVPQPLFDLVAPTPATRSRASGRRAARRRLIREDAGDAHLRQGRLRRARRGRARRARATGRVKGEAIATAQGIPLKFLENILGDLRHAGSCAASAAPRAATGWPGRPRRSPWPTSSAPSRARWPPCAASAPEEVAYAGAAEALQRVWIAVRASLRDVVEHVTLADIAARQAAARASTRLADDPEAWVTR